MLKYITYIFGSTLVLAILALGAYVPPTYAASAGIVMTTIQAGGAGAATQELIVLYNNAEEEVNISHWCLTNKSNVKFACFLPGVIDRAVYMPPHTSATIASKALTLALNYDGFTTIYESTNQSSGSIVGGSDTITLQNAPGEVVDTHSWTSSIIGGMAFNRVIGTLTPFTYLDTDSATDWEIGNSLFIPDDQAEYRTVEVPDLCANLEGLQTEIPAGYESQTIGVCRLSALSLQLTEILPNATGSDTGKEFIEIYNPNDQAVDLAQYVLLIGAELDKSFLFPANTVIAPKSYMVFTDEQMGYTLTNTTSRVQIVSEDEVIDEAPAYYDAKDDQSWALIEGTWQYSETPTPGLANTGASVEVVMNESSGPTDLQSDLKPCAPNQYRSSETNRCRLLSTTQSTIIPCKDGQYRSEETNRCRTIAAETGPAPCEEGQERNPETNRCRTIKAISTVDYAVLGEQTTNDGPNWYVWLAIGAVVLLIVGYAVWEWRYEIGKLLQRLRGAVLVRIRK